MNDNHAVRLQKIDEEALNQRLDNYLFKHLKGVPKSHVYQVLRKGRVRVNGKRAKPTYKLQLGDEVRIPPVRMAEKETPIPPSPQALETIRQTIIYDHPDFLVINKPVNFAVHGGSQVNYGIIEILRAMDPAAHFELVHRIDKATSGCLLIAKNRQALTQLQEGWRENKVEKQYLAVLLGHLSSPVEVVEAPLYKQQRSDEFSFVVVDETHGKPSKTTFKEIERYADTSLVQAILHTGRMHQIRVHSQFIGHPILGDDKYGDRAFNQAHQAKRLSLHAQSLQFKYQGKLIKVEAPWLQ